MNMKDNLEAANLSEIEGLNQRGGRTLSLVDLLAAGTVSLEMMAHCWTAIAHGASFLTAARPGGAGKSTVLANLLALLPPGERIVTVTERRPAGEEAPTCVLAHEIGAGPWYGYIWGQEVARFLALTSRGHRVASCLHADTLEELRDALLSPPLNVPPDLVAALHLVLFVHVTPDRQRRVAQVYESDGAGHRLGFRRLPGEDRFERCGPSVLFPRLGASEEEYARKCDALRRIAAQGDRDFAQVRASVLREGGGA